MKVLKKFQPYIFIFAVALLFLLICSKNSPLYEMNDWVDANAFFTVGKSMVRGVIPYKALFEQKGPLLYLIYGIGSLISFNSFIGVFILEVISFSIFLFFSFKTMKLFLDTKKCYLLIPVYTFLIVTLKSFSHGGSAEEFCLPFLMYTIYVFIKYLKTNKITSKEFLFTGITAGFIFWIKYTVLGFHLGFVLSLIIIKCKEKKYKKLLKNILYFALGFISTSIPVIIYFLLNNSLKEMIDVYFLINMRIYPKTVSIFIKLYQTIKLLFLNLFGNITYFIFIILGLIGLKNKKNIWSAKYSYLSIIICLITTGMVAYIGGTNFHYYPFIMCPFILIGLITFIPDIKMNVSIILGTIILTLIATFHLSTNTLMIKNESNYYAQNVFAEIINKKENATILNYGFLDGGFYLKTKYIPKHYYFMRNNIPYENYPEMMDSQLKYIENGEIDFVIIRNGVKGKIEMLLNGKYKLIKTKEQLYQQKKYTYYLYELINKSKD